MMFLAVIALMPAGLWVEAKEDAAIYRYTDKNGMEVFTDDLSNVPPRYRNSARKVVLPPEIREPLPPAVNAPAAPEKLPETKFFSLSSWPWEYQLVLGGVLPVAFISLWALHSFRRRTENPLLKILLKMGIIAIVLAMTYLCYFLVLRHQFQKFQSALPPGTKTINSPQDLTDSINASEQNRLKKLEDIANED